MSVLDKRQLMQLQELIGGDPSEFLELVNTFLIEAREIVAEMSGALDAKDLDVLRRSAHSLKASSQDFGATQLSGLNATLESYCRVQWPDTAAEQVDQIKVAFDHVEQELTQTVQHG